MAPTPTNPMSTTQSKRSVAVLRTGIALAALCSQRSWNPTLSVDAFGMVGYKSHRPTITATNKHFGTSSRSPSTTTPLFAALPEGYKEFGTAAIQDAARLCGMVFDDEDESKNKNRLDIDWKPGKIIVTVHGEVSLALGGVGGEEDDGSEEDEDAPEDDAPEEFSLTLLARTINRILDDDGMGLKIAEVHSIEVTTPGVSDELVPGTPQFDAFKGFEIIVEQMDPKKNKRKRIEGRLVERNDEFTIVNIKGRMKKMKNETVLSVRLPKAKKEKGGR